MPNRWWEIQSLVAGKVLPGGLGGGILPAPQFKWLKAQWVGQDIFKIYQQREATGKGKGLSPAKAAGDEEGKRRGG